MGFWPFGRRTPPGQPGERSAAPESLGRYGETLACQFLRKAGMKILARNYRCPAGEVDVIALDRSTRKARGAETIVFVEVKTRTSDRYASPAAAVDSRKQDQVRSAAAYYIAHHPTAGYRTRYDIVAVVLPDDAQPQVRHLPDAF